MSLGREDVYADPEREVFASDMKNRGSGSAEASSLCGGRGYLLATRALSILSHEDNAT